MQDLRIPNTTGLPVEFMSIHFFTGRAPQGAPGFAQHVDPLLMGVTAYLASKTMANSSARMPSGH